MHNKSLNRLTALVALSLVASVSGTAPRYGSASVVTGRPHTRAAVIDAEAMAGTKRAARSTITWATRS